MTEMHFATVCELVADRQPDAPALICADQRRNWREYEDRAARFAAFLVSRGLARDSKVGLYLHNRNEYLECQLGIMKMRGVAINVNYRYLEDELVYVLDNADCEAVVYQACYAGRVAAIRARLPRVRVWVQVADTAQASAGDDPELEALLASHAPMPRISRSEDDIYMLYTGGTTGMPKGVMYTMGQITRGLTAGWVLLGGMTALPETPEVVAEAAAALCSSGNQMISIACCPLMHGTGMWIGSMIPELMGGAVVTIPTLGLDPEKIWREVARNRVSFVVIVGDAFARPLLDELDRAKAAGQAHDISSVKAMMSSGVMWSAEVKAGLLAHHDMMLIDGMGSTEGSMGTSISVRNAVSSTASFMMGADVRVFNEKDQPVAPGSGEIGIIGTPGNVPLGYYKDPVKSAATFREIDGVRYSFPGDFARVEADGTITLLGRGSKCINTAGEKVFPEEVEEAVKRNPAIEDCLVVGLPDERFGQRVVAIASTRSGQRIDVDVLIEFTRQHLSHYKVPKQLYLVPYVQRAANGKPDYAWAQAAARELAGLAP